MSKRGFTWDQHMEKGLALQRIQLQLNRLLIDTVFVYPKGSKAVRRARQAARRVRELRSELDNRVCAENPGREGATRVYYGRLLVDEMKTRPISKSGSEGSRYDGP